MLGERLEEKIEVSHDTLGSYSDVMCGEGQDSLRGPRHVRDATPGGDRGGVRVPQYEDQPSQLGKTKCSNLSMSSHVMMY